MSLSITLDYEKMHAHFKNRERQTVNISGNIYVTIDVNYYRQSVREKITEYLDNQATHKEISEIETNYSLLYEV